MRVRRIDILGDYPMVSQFWTKRGIPAPHIVLLPDIGVIAYDDNGPVACSYLYEDKSGRVAMVEWEATNPDCTPLRCARGLDTMFDFWEIYANENAPMLILSWVAEVRGDGRLLERRGWIKCPGERHALMSFQAIPKEATCQP